MRITDQLFQRREPAVLAPLTFDHLTSKTRATLHRYALGLIKDFSDISEEDRQHLRLTYHSLVPSYPETNEEFEARMIKQFGPLPPL